MDKTFVANDGTIIAVLPLSDRPTTDMLPFLQAYSQMAGPLPTLKKMKEGAPVLFGVNGRSKQLFGLNAVDALTLLRLLDLSKEDLDMMVYHQLERDSGAASNEMGFL